MSGEIKWLRQLNLFFVAMSFFTRIPVPSWVVIDRDKLNQASRYFGLVGLMIEHCHSTGDGGRCVGDWWVS